MATIAERKCEAGRRRRAREKCGEPAAQAPQGHEQARPVDNRARGAPPACRDRKAGDTQQGRHAAKRDDKYHDFPFSRTPRPPRALVLPSPISTMPAALSAPTSFINESTLPRTTSSLASMR